MNIQDTAHPTTCLTVRFPGGKRVAAFHQGFEVVTDQPLDNGGDGSAPSPFDLFLASLATCAGYFVLRFCDSRSIPTDDIHIEQHWERDEATHRVTRIEQRIVLPDGFPAKYEKAVVRAAEQCSVKQLLADPPAVELAAVRG